MALKDLVASASELREADIEEIVANFVRYDEMGRALVLTTSGNKLPNKAKILVLLVANAGWCYINESLSANGLKPKQIEELTGIAGGTLRPLLRSLADERLVKSENANYKIVAPRLEDIKSFVIGA